MLRAPLLSAAGRAAAPVAVARRRPGGRTAFLGAMGLGLGAAALFSSSFVVNRSMHLGGGAWEWTASLRYLMILPLLAVIVGARGGLAPVLAALRAEPARWLLWSTVGFGLFYAPMVFAVAAGPAWLLAGTWQLTILAGILLAPVLYDDERAVIPRRAVAGALVVLAGVAVMQAQHVHAVGAGVLLAGVLPVVVAAFAYPAGNRRTMELAGGRLDTWQRILAMVLASLPFWLVLSTAGLVHAGAPGGGQLAQSAVVAVVGGLLATALFFGATARVRRDPTRLAAVEATQSGEVVFAAGLEAVLLGAGLPSPLAWAGIALIVAGIGSTVLRDR
ncbi:MAG TPA: multidrug resistance efflux transporter family protein [Solirubrobacteraceae bacterium]|nr:multidrug resistance efflux transporter family protein [Solirubrobacteraceae bacterium]